MNKIAGNWERGGGDQMWGKNPQKSLRFIEIYLFNMGRDRNLPTINK